MNFFTRVGLPGIYCPPRRHNINVGVCGKRQIRCEPTRTYDPAWDSWAVERGTRIHAQGKVERCSESMSYALPEGRQ